MFLPNQWWRPILFLEPPSTSSSRLSLSLIRDWWSNSYDLNIISYFKIEKEIEGKSTSNFEKQIAMRSSKMINTKGFLRIRINSLILKKTEFGSFSPNIENRFAFKINKNEADKPMMGVWYHRINRSKILIRYVISTRSIKHPSLSKSWCEQNHHLTTMIPSSLEWYKFSLLFFVFCNKQTNFFFFL